MYNSGSSIQVTRRLRNWKTFLHHSGDVLAPKLQENFPEQDTEGNYVVPALDFREQVLNIYDRRNGVGKPVFRLAPDGHERRFNVIAPGVSLMLLTMCCRQIVSVMAAPLLPRLFAAWRVEAFFFLFTVPFWWPLLVAIYLCRRLSLHDCVPSF